MHMGRRGAHGNGGSGTKKNGKLAWDSGKMTGSGDLILEANAGLDYYTMPEGYRFSIAQ